MVRWIWTSIEGKGWETAAFEKRIEVFRVAARSRERGRAWR